MRYIFGGDFHSSLHILLFTKTHTFYFRRCKLIFFVIAQRGVNTTIFFKFPVTRNTHEEHNFT